ncbi:MAG: methane monooxygenase, partial [Hyphomicrobium sp.]
IYEDYYRTYMLPLEKYGIKIHHDDVSEAWDRLVKKNYVHKIAQFFSVGWPVNFWRIEAQTEKDFEWFEKKYPGWYAEFGDYWKWYAKKSVPGQKNMLFDAENGYAYPHRCWSCMCPAVIREDFCVGEVDGELYTYCSEQCKWTHQVAFQAEYEGRATPAMGRFKGRRIWEECYHGWSLADCIKDLGFVRPDGKTIVAQPHLRFEAKDQWTLDDIKGDIIQSPLTLLRQMSPADREKHVADYRKGFKINAFA